MAGDTDEAAGCMRRVRPGIYRRPRHAEILQFLLPPLRPPARREQSCPFVAEKGSPAYFPLPEMRQAGAGDRADGPVHQVLFSPLRAPVLEAFQEGQLRRHPESLPMPQLRNLRRDHGAEGQADDFLQPGLPGTMVFLTPNKERNDS